MSSSSSATNDAPTRIDLDHNATTRPLPEVVEVVARHLRESYANPGSRHAAGRVARRTLESARERMAALLGAEPDEVIFTSGGTESINLFLFGATQGTPGTIALTAGEHPATVEACRQFAARGWKLHTLAVDSQGRLIPEQYGRVGYARQLGTGDSRSPLVGTAHPTELPWDTLRLVTVILAHNETGVVQDVAPLAERCRERGVPLHLDAVQAVGKIPVDFRALGVAGLSLGAHKFHGPRGVGALLLKRGVRLAPHLFGGHQEQGRRPGTEPVALIAGMAKALELWSERREEIAARIAALRDRLERGLRDSCTPVIVHGEGAERLPNTLNIAFPGSDGEALLVAVDLEGVACSLGSTCASGSAEPAPALLAMGCPLEVARASLRFSLGVDNTEDEMDEAIRRIARVVERLKKTSGNRSPSLSGRGLGG
ncbi:MAG: cysteine desulfurase family protein [Planctomycetales bacterium]